MCIGSTYVYSGVTVHTYIYVYTQIRMSIPKSGGRQCSHQVLVLLLRARLRRRARIGRNVKLTANSTKTGFSLTSAEDEKDKKADALSFFLSRGRKRTDL